MGDLDQHIEDLEAIALGGDSAPAWPAAASAIQLMFWQDKFAGAGALACEVIHRFGRASAELAKQKRPFDDAILALNVYAGVPAEPRLEAAISDLPPDSVLAKRLGWLLPEFESSMRHYTLLTGYQDWDELVGEVAGPEAELAQQDLASLSPREQEQLWQAAQSDNDFPVAERLYRATGQLSDRWFVAAWFAGHLSRRGREAEASQLLIDALPGWRPLGTWDLVPTDVVLQPDLQLAATAEVREYFLDTAVAKLEGRG